MQRLLLAPGRAAYMTESIKHSRFFYDSLLDRSRGSTVWGHARVHAHALAREHELTHEHDLTHERELTHARGLTHGREFTHARGLTHGRELTHARGLTHECGLTHAREFIRGRLYASSLIGHCEFSNSKRPPSPSTRKLIGHCVV